MIYKKKGVIELQFNWIFILIAGAIIFVFFINIVNKQREFSEVKTSGTIITNLESILTGAQISTDTVNIIDMPKVDIGFECNRYFIGPVPKQTKNSVIFAPNLLKGKQLITWALDWNMPYRITNFLYITDPQIRYVIVYDEDTEEVANKIFDKLPKEMNKEKFNMDDPLQEFKDKNNYKVKFIFLTDIALSDVDNNGLKDLKRMPDEDVTAIKIIFGASTVIPSTGTINFLQKDGDVWVSRTDTFYLKEESLFGAIFAADLEMYNCVMKKAFTKLNLLSKIYVERSSKLSDFYGIDNHLCASAHSKAVNHLEIMRDTSEERTKNFPDGIQISNINDMLRNSNQIGGTQESANYQAQLFSCALIY